MSKTRSRAPGNEFGVWEAAFGLVVGFLLSILAVSAYSGASGGHPGTIGTDIVEFLGLWTGFVGAAIVASRTRLGQSQESGGAAGRAPVDVDVDVRPSLVQDYGFRLRPWPDVPLGIAVGLAAQYGLVPLTELPLQPFVQNLNSKLSHPAKQLFSPHINGLSLWVLTVLVCIGSPLVEELFFRGLLLRGLLGRLGVLGARRGPAAAIVITGVVFGLVHFEELQFIGLASFGMVLAYLAYRTGRLGPSIMAHVAFNSATVVAILVTRLT
ncbi:MAG TPA: CPBP family intramembrane glutamic endopeptidase [Acidimicrobiales bacterium]|nr:CPBP family intramembrane glutamic endopeptidase [Acidimicrobiales bacterium]